MRSISGYAAFLCRHAVILSLLAACALCLLSLLQPFLLLVDALYDIYIPLDAGSRLLQGVFPTRDYPSAIGPLYAIVHGLALSFSSADARALVRADAIMLAVSYLLVWPVLRGVASSIKAIILLLLAAMMMSPLGLDFIWHSYRYVADYNRWAWGFMAVILAWVWNPGGRDRLGQVALGVALIALFYLKLTIFAGAVACLGVGLLCDRDIRPCILPAVLTLVAIGLGLAIGFVLPYLGDNMAVAQATGSVRWSKLILQAAAPFNFFPTALVIAVAFDRSIPRSRRLLLLGTTALQHLAALQNFDTVVPLIGLPLLLAGRELAVSTRRWWRPALAYLPALLQAGGLFLVAATALIAVPWMAAAVDAQPMAGAGQLGARIKMITEAPVAMGLGHGDLPYAGGTVFAQIKSAQQLLADQPQGTRVATLEISNIALTLWPSLRQSPGALLWYDYQRSFSGQFYPRPQEAFAGADVILMPLHFTTDTTQHLVTLYRPWLDRCATVIGDNGQWRLYKPPVVRQEAVRETEVSAAGDVSGNTDCFVLARR